MLGLRDGLAVIHSVVVVLVVVRRAFLYRLRRNSACLIGVDGRILREVIVAIAHSRLERGDRVARFLASPLVGVEGHLARFGVGVLLNISLHSFIRVLQQIERRRLHAGGVQHRDRRGVRDAHGVLRQIDGEVAQRNQGCGHLHLHLVAHRRIVRTRDGDHDVLQVGIGQTGMHVAAEMVRVDVSVRGLGLAAVHRSVVHELGQVGDLHVIAQLIVEGDIAGFVLKAFARLRGIAGALRDLLGDVVEHVLQLIGIGRALVERGVFAIGALRTIAEVPFVFARPPTRALVSIRGRRVVARHGVHEVVLVGNALRIGVRGRIGALEDADGVHRSTRVLHFLSVPNGTRGDVRGKLAIFRRRAVGEEDDDFLGIGAIGGLTLRKLQACGGIRCTGGLDGVHLGREGAFRIVSARSQRLHHLAVVVPILAFAIRVVADLVGLVSSELHDGDLMLLGGILDRRVLLGDLVDERVRRALERVDALRVIAAAHGVVHRPGGVEHQHDVERRGRRIGQVRGGRQRRERSQKVRTILLGYGDAVLADLIVRHGLVGPNAPDARHVVLDKPLPIPNGRGVRDGGLVAAVRCRRRAVRKRRAAEQRRQRKHQHGGYRCLETLRRFHVLASFHRIAAFHIPLRLHMRALGLFRYPDVFMGPLLPARFSPCHSARRRRHFPADHRTRAQPETAHRTSGAAGIKPLRLLVTSLLMGIQGTTPYMRTYDPDIPFSQVNGWASGGRINDPRGQCGQAADASQELAAKVSHLGEIEKRRCRNTGYNRFRGHGHAWKEGCDGQRETRK